jgi:raffinose/stachyose/melibiose transport system substrate-binding protein
MENVKLFKPRRLRNILWFGIFALLLLGSANAQQQIKIQMWHWAANKEPIFENTVIPAYEKLHPNVTIVPRVIPKDSYFQVLTAAQIGGKAPALFHGNPMGDVLQQWKNGQVLDLTPFVDKKWKAALYPSTLKTLTIDGKILSMSTATNNVQVLYNKDRFNELGIKTPITTMDGMQKAVDTLRQHGYGGALYWASANDQAPTLFIDWAEQKYPDLFEAADRGDGKWTIPQFVNLMTKFNSYSDIWMSGVGSESLDQEVHLFATGKASMYIIGNWAVNSIEASHPKFQIGVFPVPGIDTSTRPAALGSTAGTWMVSSQASKAQQQAAIDFLRFFVLNYQGAVVKGIGLCPAGPPGEAALNQAKPLAQAMCKAQATSVPRDMFDAQARDALSAGIQGMLVGQATPKDVLKGAQRTKRR